VLQSKRAQLEDPSIASNAPRLVAAQAEVEAAQKALDALYVRWAELEEWASVPGWSEPEQAVPITAGRSRDAWVAPARIPIAHSRRSFLRRPDHQGPTRRWTRDRAGSGHA
jgi:hypothetical protein